MALCAEEIEIFLGPVDIAVKPEEQVSSRYVRRSVALRGVRPVENIRGAVFGNDDIRRVEVAVAKFVVLGHGVKAGVEFVTNGRVEIGLRNLTIHFVFQLG